MDMNTIIESFVFINVATSILIFFLWMQFHKRYKGIDLLLYGFILQTINFTLVALRGQVPDWISIDLAYTFCITGIFLVFLGIETYLGKRTPLIYNLLVVLVSIGIHFWFTLADNNLTIRKLNLSAASLIFFIQGAYLLLFRVSKDKIGFTHPAALAYVFSCLISLSRIVYFSLNQDFPENFFMSDKFDVIMMIMYQISVIVLTYSLVIMFSKSLISEITSEEEKFRMAFDTSPNAIIMTSYGDDTIIDANSTFYTLTGFDKADVVGRSTAEIDLWEKPEERKHFTGKLLSASGLISDEVFMKKKNGDKIFCSVTGESIITGQKKLHMYSIKDITKQHIKDEIMKYERNLMITLLDNLPEPVSVKDKNGRYILNNKAHLDILGVKTREEALGKTAFDFFSEDEALIYDADDKRVLGTGIKILDKIEYAVNNSTGLPYWHLTSKIPVYDELSGSTYLLIVSHDITEKKKNEESLNNNTIFIRSLLKTIPFDIQIIDQEGTVMFQNERQSMRYGDAAIGKKCWELHRDDGKQCTNCPLKKDIPAGTTELLQADGLMGGRVFNIYHTGMTFKGKKALLEVFYDITELKRTEYELIKAKEKAEESSRLKTAFLNNISHEIRTPMNAIVGFTALMSVPGLTPEAQKEYLEIITQNSNHLLSIVTDIIDISNVESGKLKTRFTEVNPETILNNLLIQYKPKADEKGISLNLSLPEKTSRVEKLNTDNTKLVQIITNLLSNALKFTQKGSVEFGYTTSGSFLQFFVSDTGIGIPEENQELIFERFYQVDSFETRQYEGTGLGLSLAKAYVELLGGKIWVKSIVNKGSTFYFTIPYKN